MPKPKKQLENVIGYDHQLYVEDFAMKLDFNENPLGPSKKVVDAIKNINADEIKLYPAYGELISKIAEVNGVDTGMVLPTNGADEAICYLINTFLESDENIVTAVPTFVMSKIYSRISNCSYKEVPYKQKWVYPIEDILSAIDSKTKMVLVTSPNSPTADSIKREDLTRIVEKAKDALVVIDQTYGNYSDKNYIDFAKKYSNVAVVKSMSKDFALAGLRLGYVISDSANIDNIKKIFNPFSVNLIATKAGVAALNDVEHFERVKKEIIESKRIISEGLKGIATVYPSDANFLCVDFGKSWEFIYEKLLRNGIKVKVLHDKGAENHFRISMPSNADAKKLLASISPSKLMIFDIDGVLVDTSKSYRFAIKSSFEFFAKRELSFDEIQTAKNSGGLNNDWDLTEHLLLKEGISIPKQDIIDKFQEFYWGENGSGLIKNEELLIEKEKLEKLAKTFDLAIFTGRPRSEALFILKHFGIDHLFNPVITMDDLPSDRQKPYPDGILKIIEIARPTETFYLGDTPDDMMAAKSAKVKAIGILPPQDKSENLKKLMLNHQAMVILEDTNKITEYMGV